MFTCRSVNSHTYTRPLLFFYLVYYNFFVIYITYVETPRYKDAVFDLN